MQRYEIVEESLEGEGREWGNYINYSLGTVEKKNHPRASYEPDIIGCGAITREASSQAQPTVVLWRDIVRTAYAELGTSQTEGKAAS